MGIHGKQWEKLGNNEKTWETMGNNAKQFKQRETKEKMGNNGKQKQTTRNNGQQSETMGIWDPTHFPMLPNASHRILKMVGFNDICWEPMGDDSEIMGTQMGIDRNCWDELRFPSSH